MNKKDKNILLFLLMVVISCVYTILIVSIDVKPIGPNYSSVGFASLNKFFVDIIGTNMGIYKITEYLGYIALSYMFVYAFIGLYQLIKRKGIKQVDSEIYVLACFYIFVLGIYLLFEKLVINYRPVLMDGALDPSYPSSHTMLAICFCGSSIIINNLLFKKVKGIKLVNLFSLILMFAIAIGRFISGVHWFTDILGGIIISLCLLQLFKTGLVFVSKKKLDISISKFLITILSFVVILALCLFVNYKIENNNRAKLYNNTNKKEQFNKDGLPLPEVTGGIRGELGIDKNINELTIDNYLGRDDSVYRDMRMLEDPASYEAIGGNRFLNGYVKGFEIVPLPYIFQVEDLPEEVGDTYTGETLFIKTQYDSFKPRFKESMSIIEELFPKDKYIFLMCGGGGYAGMMKDFLVFNGWDYNKIWVVGGYWYYSGENNIEVPLINGKYDFSNIPYHSFDFNKLTSVHNTDPNKVTLTSRYYDTSNNQEFYDLFKDYYDLVDDENISQDEALRVQNESYKNQGLYINKLVENKESFILAFTEYEEDCSEDLSLDFLAGDVSNTNNIFIYIANPAIYNNTVFFKNYRYTPGVLIVKEGKVFKYFDANDNFTLELKKAHDDENGNPSKLLEDWLRKYVNF